MKLKTHLLTYLTMAAIWPTTAFAATISDEQAAALIKRLNALEKEVVTLRGKLDSVQSEQKVQTEVVETIAETSKLKSNTTTKWKGAPEIKGDNGWSVKSRGRVLYDFNHLSSVPSTVDISGEGFSNEARRVRLGIQGSMPGGFGYKFEADFLSGVVITDAYMSYKEGPVKITVGQHNTFQGLEELSSSNDTSFSERSAWTDAFGFERRVGVSAAYKTGDFSFNGGIFTDNIEDLDDGNNSLGFDGRVVYAPKFDNAQLHFGSSLHVRDLGDSIDTIRYRQRPLVHSVDTRFINTDRISGAEDELTYGFEAAIISGRFHAAAETHWAQVGRVDLADPTFFGGSIEAGYFLTNDKREYKGGVFKGVKVNNPVGNGGMGALQVNVRFDQLDLVDADVVGGKQDAYMASLIWTPINHVRFLLNYAHLSYSDALDIVEGAPNDFSVNVWGARAQVSF